MPFLWVVLGTGKRTVTENGSFSQMLVKRKKDYVLGLRLSR